MAIAQRFDLERIKADTNIEDLARDLGLQPNDKGLARCPGHNDQGAPNLKLYDDHVHCYRCEFHADAVGLVMKARDVDFAEAVDFLAQRIGLKPGKGKSTSSRAKSSPAMAIVAPKMNRDLVNKDPWPDGFEEAIIERYREGYEGLPVDPEEYFALWDEVDRLVALATVTEAEAGWLEWLCRRVGYKGPRPAVSTSGKPVSDARGLRARVFDALLVYTVAAAGEDPVPASDWLRTVKGIEFETQRRFNLRWLESWRSANDGMKKTFGVETLRRLGLVPKDPKKSGEDLYFKRHRLLLPFMLKGQVIDVQGRDFQATDKRYRFLNTASANPIPYNADALFLAREAGDPIFICEGATDTLALAQAGRHVVGIVGTGGFKRAWLRDFIGLDVFLAFDGDEAGRAAGKKVASLFVEYGLPSPKVLPIPDGMDINEFLHKEG